jgi:hypothetical protein
MNKKIFLTLKYKFGNESNIKGVQTSPLITIQDLIKKIKLNVKVPFLDAIQIYIIRKNHLLHLTENDTKLLYYDLDEEVIYIEEISDTVKYNILVFIIISFVNTLILFTESYYFTLFLLLFHYALQFLECRLKDYFVIEKNNYHLNNDFLFYAVTSITHCFYQRPNSENELKEDLSIYCLFSIVYIIFNLKCYFKVKDLIDLRRKELINDYVPIKSVYSINYGLIFWKILTWISFTTANNISFTISSLLVVLCSFNAFAIEMNSNLSK